MSWNDRVIWSEGMFLQPQHFQQQDRHFERLLEQRARPLLAHGWGFAQIALDGPALGLGKLQLTSARGILPDGTPFDFPQHDEPPLPLEVGLETKNEIILLGLPVRRPGMAESNLSDGQDAALARFGVADFEASDANASATGSVLLQVGRLRLKLMRARDATDAYTALRVTRVMERRADNQLVLQKGYIPPMLHAGQDPVLAGYIRDLHGLLHQRGEALSARLSQPGRGGVAEIADFLLLQTLNRHEPGFAHLTRHSLLHPEQLFVLCLELAGDLATFSHTRRRPPAYAEYQHDSLHECFEPLIADLRRSLSMVIELNAVAIELQDRKHGVKVAIISDSELLRTASFVLAVNAQIGAEALRTRFPSQVKIGPVERIRDLVNLALPGIALRSLPVAPRQIPFHAGFNYFELERGGELWKQLERSGGLAMFIAGEFPGLEMEFWAIRG